MATEYNRSDFAPNPLPSVAGRMEMTHAEFQRACQIKIQEQLDKGDFCDTSMIHVLSEGVRCSRECVHIATMRVS